MELQSSCVFPASMTMWSQFLYTKVTHHGHGSLKDLEHIICSFTFFILTVQSLCDHQHGFWSNHSCETQLISAANDFAICLNNEHMIPFLRFPKAFDKVSHERLCYKLSYCITGPLLLWIEDFLSNRTHKGQILI